MCDARAASGRRGPYAATGCCARGAPATSVSSFCQGGLDPPEKGGPVGVRALPRVGHSGPAWQPRAVWSYRPGDARVFLSLRVSEPTRGHRIAQSRVLQPPGLLDSHGRAPGPLPTEAGPSIRAVHPAGPQLSEGRAARERERGGFLRARLRGAADRARTPPRLCARPAPKSLSPDRFQCRFPVSPRPRASFLEELHRQSPGSEFNATGPHPLLGSQISLLQKED